jgi:hypothetical protein
MVTVPAAIAVTTPVETSIVATAGLLVYHSPVPVAELKVAVDPEQTCVAPITGVDVADTVTVLVMVAPQPVE